MPTYTYECKKCGERFDHFHGINATPRIKCEACGGACKKMLGTGAGIIFKGSGFYETDNKTKNGGKSDSGSERKSSESPKSGSSESAKSEKSKSDSSSSSGSSKKESTSKKSEASASTSS